VGFSLYKKILEISNMIVYVEVWLGMDNNVKDILTSGRRDKMEIIAAIIAMTQKPSNLTRIMGQVGLNHPLVKEYLRFMLRLRSVERCKVVNKGRATRQVFQATEKGFTFLKTYCNILRIIYGEDFLQNDDNLVVACLQNCKEAE
jgi:predicted transcriptional regulator